MMKNSQIKIVVFILLVLLFPLLAVAIDNNSPDPAKQASSPPTYKPPHRGAPAGRVGGGTRGDSERESFSLQVLTPEQIGYTGKDQPCLYWFVSKPTTHFVEMTITERHAVQPLFTKIIPGSEKGGIQEFCLADYGVHLKTEVPYKWFVVLITDKKDRSKDILAGGMIQKIAASNSLENKLSLKNMPSYFAYAEEGYWFDSLEAITRDIKGAHNKEELIKQRAALLKQVGLTEVADAETVRQ